MYWSKKYRGTESECFSGVHHRGDESESEKKREEGTGIVRQTQIKRERQVIDSEPSSGTEEKVKAMETLS